MAAHPRLVRCLTGAVVGAGLVLAWWGAFRLSPSWPLRVVGDDTCRADFGCGFSAAIVGVVLTVSLVITLSVAVGWVVLWAVRVRPAWPVALLGPVLGWVVWWLASPVLDEVFGPTTWRVVVAMGVGYGLTGLVSARRGA